MPSAYPAPGDHIGRFRIVAQLGAGGMGVVYSAVEENLSRNVALKVISPQFAHDADFRARFGREARALASLDSAYVVQVFAHGEEDGYLYIATQLIPDGDLGRMLKAQGPPPVSIAVRLMEQVASGLADAHDMGLVHRDIKPGNVLVRRRGVGMQAYLGDFGIARRVDAEATRVGGPAIGTPSYMAPELHTGVVASISTDVYALGCLLWVTLTGSAPYPGNSEYEIVNAHVSGAVPQLSGSAPMVLAVNRILRLSMAKQPDQRYPSAAMLRDDLQAALRLPDDASVGQAQGFASGAPTHAARATPTPSSPAGQYSPPAAGAPVYGPSAGAATPGRKSRAPLWIALAGVAALLAGFGVAALITFVGA